MNRTDQFKIVYRFLRTLRKLLYGRADGSMMGYQLGMTNKDIYHIVDKYGRHG